MSPGRELDALVAEKVMGRCFHAWRVQYHGYADEAAPAPHITGWTAACFKCGAWEHSFGGHGSPPADWTDHRPAYSTDIRAAWEVVEKLRSEDKWLHVIPVDDGWLIGDDDADGFVEDPEQHAGSAIVDLILKRCATAATAPHAICLAALQAVGVGVPRGETPQ